MPIDLSYPQIALIVVAAALVIHQISFKLLVSPAKYKEAVTLRTAHSAFKEDHSSVPAKQLVPYKHTFRWRTLLNFYALNLHRDAPARFAELRRMWGIDEDEYRKETLGKWGSFGSVGLSGSMFFHSEDKRFLLKSLGRTFENRFLHQHFLPAYFDYVQSNPGMLLNKVLDVLYSFDHRFGEWIRASPSHFIVIENISADKKDDWEIFDLKPTGYLEPYRDLVPERVQMSGTTDILPADKPLVMSAEDRAAHLDTLRKDLDFLANLGCIDYSLLVVRPPDGRGVRIALIDVFWSLREPRAKVTKHASDAAGLPQQTVTADAHGYAKDCYRLLEGAIVTPEQWDARRGIRDDVVLLDI